MQQTRIQQLRPIFHKKSGHQKLIGRTIIFLILVGVSVLMIFPLLWMISTALKPNYSIFVFPPELIPNPVLWSNFIDIFQIYPVAKYTLNTAYVTGMNIVGTLVSCTLVAYGFAKFKVPGRDLLFILMLSTMMIPWAVTMVPMFILFTEIGWYNTYYPLWFPAFFGNAFFIFLLRQFFLTIPHEMDEAAKIDGASTLQILWHVHVPLLRAPLLVLTLFTFFNVWNDFLGPLIYLGDPDKATLQLAIQNLRTRFQAEWNYIMALSILSIIPCILVFFFGQKRMLDGINLTGIKG